MTDTLKNIGKELRAHAPFTIFGALLGIGTIVVIDRTGISRSVSEHLFEVFHPLHVLLSAMVTVGLYRLYGKRSLWATVLIGYFGSVGIATLSDCVIPYLGEYLLGFENREIHLGFVEEWWLVNPLALIGIGIACLWPRTKFPHAGHVLLSTAASLFHMTMGLGDELSPLMIVVIPVFLFLAVWLPCCASDIVFPLLFSGQRQVHTSHTH